MSRDVTNADLFGHLKAALAELVQHVAGNAECGSTCICDMPPQDKRSNCSAYRDAVDLLEVVKRKDDVIVLDTVVPPIPGAASVEVPGGEVAIDQNTNDVVLLTRTGPQRWTSDDAFMVGVVLVVAALESKRQPDPAEVAQLTAAMADFGEPNQVALARRLVALGWKRDKGDD
ncbi:hypothetical protein [Nonomuraea glycinis]|uniref:hypothetical protein n=1 Tax=Nonomuraea glycinis TaxID=2047744 RepID=UPI0033B16B09